MESMLADNIRVMARGQITLPKDIRKALGISIGDRLTLLKQDDQIIMINSAVYAMKELQKAMVGEAEKAGLYTEDDVTAMIMDMRARENE